MMGQELEQLLRRYGQTVELHYSGNEAGVTARAFVQPIFEQGEDKWQDLPTPLGRTRRERLLYLGEPGVPLEGLESAGWVEYLGRRFQVQAAQPVYVGSRISHWRAVLRPGDEVWDERT